MRQEIPPQFVAVPRIFKLHAIKILEEKKIEYLLVDIDELPDGKYELSAIVKGQLYHCPQVVILYTTAKKEDLLNEIEKRICKF